MTKWMLFGAFVLGGLLLLAFTGSDAEANRGFYILAAAIFSALFAPVGIELWKVDKARRSMKKMVLVDIKATVKIFRQAIQSLETNLSDTANDFWEEPHIVVENPEQNVIDMKAEKWHLDPDIFADFYEFHAEYQGTIAHIADFRTTEFKSLRKARKVASYNLLLQKWKKIVTIGERIIERLEDSSAH